MNHFSHESPSVLSGEDQRVVHASDLPYKPSAPYFLYFGVIEKTKGLDKALAAFHELRRNLQPHYPIEFVVVGAPGNLYKEIRPQFDEPGVRYLGHVSDSDLKELVSGAVAVLFLSEYEGFGFPAVEAMLLGARVLVSRGTVLEEVCGDFAKSIDCLNVQVIAGAMASLVTAEKNEAQIQAQKRYLLETYNWRVAASQLLAGLLSTRQ